jgi:hypothetical protein
MAKVNKSQSGGEFRGKVGRYIYSLQPDGTTTVRGVGTYTKPRTAGQERGQDRLRLGNDYVHAVMSNPELRPVYTSEAEKRRKRTCDVAISDFLADPVITSVDATKYNGLAGGWLLVMTGDEFKVVRVRVVIRSADGKRLEDGLAVRAEADSARVWMYTAKESLAPGQTLTIEVMATDRPGHSRTMTAPHAI